MEVTVEMVAEAIHDQYTKRRMSEEAAAYLKSNGAVYVRAVFHKKSGWWSTDDVFLGARSIEARAELERMKGK